MTGPQQERPMSDKMREALEVAREAIASVAPYTFGGATVERSDGSGAEYQYPIRDELLANIDAALQATPSRPVSGQPISERRHFAELMNGPTEEYKSDIWRQRAMELADKCDQMEATLTAPPAAAGRGAALHKAWQAVGKLDHMASDTSAASFEYRKKMVEACETIRRALPAADPAVTPHDRKGS